MEYFINTIEVCAADGKSCLTAAKSGADRVELCSALAMGGVTPSFGLIAQACKIRDEENQRSLCKTFKVHVLIRPRPGDFCYSRQELEIICSDIYQSLLLGVDGVVLGALTPEGDLDVTALQQMIDVVKRFQQEQIQGLAQGLPQLHETHLVLHRAFDICRDPFVALEQAYELGFKTILTSGQRATAQDGIPVLKQLVDYCKEKGIQLQIMAGSGVNASNAKEIALHTGVHALHLSASGITKSPSTFYPHADSLPSFGGQVCIPNMDYPQTDQKRLKDVIHLFQ